VQERGDIVTDACGRWVEARELAWEILPARVEGVIGERIGRLTPCCTSCWKWQVRICGRRPPCSRHLP